MTAGDDAVVLFTVATLGDESDPTRRGRVTAGAACAEDDEGPTSGPDCEDDLPSAVLLEGGTARLELFVAPEVFAVLVESAGSRALPFTLKDAS